MLGLGTAARGPESGPRAEERRRFPKDSVVGIGEARATLAGPGPAVLSLRLASRGGSISNEYAFRVSEGGGGRGLRGPSAPEG
jgi:hypothetical protein